MRTNLPVTTVEYPITDETLIVSKTDTKGPPDLLQRSVY